MAGRVDKRASVSMRIHANTFVSPDSHGLTYHSPEGTNAPLVRKGSPVYQLFHSGAFLRIFARTNGGLVDNLGKSVPLVVWCEWHYRQIPERGTQ